MAWERLVSCPDPTFAERKRGLVTIRHPAPTLEGCNQHTIVSDHVDRIAEHITLCCDWSFHVPDGLTSLGRAGCRIVTRPFFSGRVGSGHETSERRDCIFLSSSFLGMSAVFHCLSLSKVSTVVYLCYSVVSKLE